MSFFDRRKIREHLKNRDAALYSRFLNFEIQSGKLIEWSQAGSHLTFTTHGFSHVDRVEDTYDWLLSDEDVRSFTSYEAFCLLCATKVHDVFMIPRFLGDETRARAEHATKATNELRRLQDRLGITTSETLAIGEIIRGHHVEKISELRQDSVLGRDRVRIRMLGACLSMADICHADESRAPSIVYDYLSMNEESAWHWKRHMQISGINRSENNILVSAISFSDEGKKDVINYVDQIRQQLSRISPYFRSELYPLVDVELRLQELESELDQNLSFKADATAILELLISGVYQQTDVFIRELIQNALDATYVEAARCRKNGTPYRANLSVTGLHNEYSQLIAVRIDDNGYGMDVTEVKDTLLRIGQSRNTKESIKNILINDDKQLIANFGVGLLSCFKVSSKIIISTQRGDDGRPFEVKMGAYGDKVELKEVARDIGGTSVIVYLKNEFCNLKLSEVTNHYCRMLNLENAFWYTTSDETDFNSSRQAMIKSVGEGGIRIQQMEIGGESIKIQGNGYFSQLSIPWNKGAESISDTRGVVTILNDGIFVCEDKAEEWLPQTFSYCSGVINFAAKSIDLPVARNAVVKNEKVQRVKADLEERSSRLLEKIVAESVRTPRRDKVAALLAYALIDTKGKTIGRMLREAGGFHVQVFGGSQKTLKEIVEGGAKQVFVTYEEGNSVRHLSVIDGKQLWHKNDELAAMQAELAANRGEIVIEATSTKIPSGKSKIRELDVIKKYFDEYDVEVVDLLETVPFAGILRALSLKRDLRNFVGKRVKFVEPGIKPSKLGWDLSDELWLNVTNPIVGAIYEKLKSGSLLDDERLALEILINLLDYNFDAAIKLCTEKLVLGNRGQK